MSSKLITPLAVAAAIAIGSLSAPTTLLAKPNEAAARDYKRELRQQERSEKRAERQQRRRAASEQLAEERRSNPERFYDDRWGGPWSVGPRPYGAWRYGPYSYGDPFYDPYFPAPVWWW